MVLVLLKEFLSNNEKSLVITNRDDQGRLYKGLSILCYNDGHANLCRYGDRLCVRELGIE